MAGLPNALEVRPVTTSFHRSSSYGVFRAQAASLENLEVRPRDLQHRSSCLNFEPQPYGESTGRSKQPELQHAQPIKRTHP